jgi:pentatricopeptide repeat protein
VSYILKTKPFHLLQNVKFSIAKNQISDSYGSFLVYIKNKQVEPAVKLFHKMKLELSHQKKKLPIDTYSSLSHLFSRAEHLEFAEQLYHELIQDHSQPNEQIYLALIRCCCDHGDIDRAYALLNDILNLPSEPRLRTYHPLIECLCFKKNNPTAVIDLFKEMMSKKINPSSDQICIFLQSSLQQSSFQNSTFLTEVHNIIDTIGFDLLGLTLEESIQLNVACMNSTVHEVLDQVSYYQMKDNLVDML